MTNHKTRRITLAALLFGAALALTGCKDNNAANSNGGTPAGSPPTANTPAPSGDAIVIGEYGSFTGSEASFGQDTHNGIQMAIDEANAAGGVEFAGTKKQITLVKEDDASDQSKVAGAMNLLFEKNPTLILGEVASGLSKAGGTLCQSKQVPMISPSSTQKSVTEIGPYIFRVCFIDPYQAAVVARFAKDGLKAANVAVYTNKDTDYSKGFSKDFQAAFERYGGKVILQRFYGKTDKDYKSALSAIAAAKPDAILVPGYYSDAGAIAKQARELGITVPLLGGDGWDDQQLFTFGGDGLKNCYFSDHANMTDPNPPVKTFVDAYKAKYAGKTPGTMAVLGYDAAKLAIDAMKRAKSPTKDALRDAIADTKGYTGVTGSITIDKDRNAAKTAVIIAPKDGVFTLAKTIPDPEKPL